MAEAAYELETFQPNLTRAEADLRIAMLAAKLRLLDGPPHTLRRHMLSRRFPPPWTAKVKPNCSSCGTTTGSSLRMFISRTSQGVDRPPNCSLVTRHGESQ